MEGYLERVQRSVFEGEVSLKQFRTLRQQMEKLKLGPDDSVRFYQLCGKCEKRIHLEGSGKVVRAATHFIV